MKKTIFKIIICILTIPLLGACSKDEEQQPRIVLHEPLEDFLSGKCWYEKVYIVYDEGGETIKGVNIAYDPVILLSAGYGSNLHPFLIEEVKRAPNQKHYIRSFVRYDTDYWRYITKYWLECNDENLTVKISSGKNEGGKIAVSDVEMKIISLSENQVTFEAPAKGYIKYLYGADETFNPNVSNVHINVIWSRCKQESPFNSVPL